MRMDELMARVEVLEIRVRDMLVNSLRLRRDITDFSKPPPGLICSARLGAVEKLL